MSGNEVILSQEENQDLDQAMRDIAGQLSTTSRRVYASDAKHFAHWLHSQGLTPGNMTRSDMIAYRTYLSEAIQQNGKPYSKATKQRMFAVACRLMNEQYINGAIAVKVTTEVKGFRTDSDETTHTALSMNEARDMLKQVDISTKQGKRDYAILLTLLKTGLRRSELVALNRGNLKWMDGHHVAIVEHGKGDKKRVVKLRVDVWRSLEAYFAILPAATDATPVFVSFRRGDHPTTRRMTDKSIELIVTRYAPDGSNLTPHGMRATFATLALEEKAPLHQVQYAMGHKDPRTTERYQRRKLNLDDNAVDVLNF